MSRSAVVYSRKGCHLCEQLIEELLPLVRGRWTISVVDIDQDADLRQRYNERVPVLEVDGAAISEYRLDRQRVLAMLAADNAAGGPPRNA